MATNFVSEEWESIKLIYSSESSDDECNDPLGQNQLLTFGNQSNDKLQANGDTTVAKSSCNALIASPFEQSTSETECQNSSQQLIGLDADRNGMNTSSGENALELLQPVKRTYGKAKKLKVHHPKSEVHEKTLTNMPSVGSTIPMPEPENLFVVQPHNVILIANTKTTLKRKLKADSIPTTTSKFQKLHHSEHVSARKAPLQEISINRIAGVKTIDASARIDRATTSASSAKYKSIKDCVALLQRNGISLKRVSKKEFKENY